MVERYFGVECEAQRVLGPLEWSRFPRVHISPFGVIPKSEPGKWRLILDLFSPLGSSVLARKCAPSRTFLWMMWQGRGVLMAKFDLKSAYRQVLVHPDDLWMLGMDWKGRLYVDKALPFGLRSAPMIFNAVAEALAYIIKQRGVGWVGSLLTSPLLVVWSVVGISEWPWTRV